MLTRILNLLFGSKNERELQRFRPQVEQINALEPSLPPLEAA